MEEGNSGGLMEDCMKECMSTTKEKVMENFIELMEKFTKEDEEMGCSMELAL